MLRFSPANTKLQKLEKKIGKTVYSLDLLSGHNCPFANICLSKAVKLPNGKLKVQDGPNTEFRCYSASQEARLSEVYNFRKHNDDELLPNRTNMLRMAVSIRDSMPKKAEVIRIHSAGDFFSQSYFDAWINVIIHHPNIHFYAYTKSLRFWVNRIKQIPHNFTLTASYGGLDDHLIEKHKLRACHVVYSKKDAKKMGLAIDKDDSLAYNKTYKKNFCLLIHGTQPIGTDAAKALYKLRKKK